MNIIDMQDRALDPFLTNSVENGLRGQKRIGKSRRGYVWLDRKKSGTI